MTSIAPPPERMFGSARSAPNQARNVVCTGPAKSNVAMYTKPMTYVGTASGRMRAQSKIREPGNR